MLRKPIRPVPALDGQYTSKEWEILMDELKNPPEINSYEEYITYYYGDPSTWTEEERQDWKAEQERNRRDSKELAERMRPFIERARKEHREKNK